MTPMATGPSGIRFGLDERPNETLSAFLVAVVDKANEIGFFDALVEGLNVPMKVVHYSHRNKIETLVASMVVGCRHIAEISTKLGPDTVAARLFGMKRFPDQSQINSFLRAFGPQQVGHLASAHRHLLVEHSRAGNRALWVRLTGGQRVLPVDLDQTSITTRSRRAEGATEGYFGRKRGGFGYKKSLALLGGDVREVLFQRLEGGNVHGQDAVPMILAELAFLADAKGIRPQEILVRGDSQYGSTGVLRQLQAAGYHYLLKGYTPRTAHALSESLPQEVLWHYRGLDSNGSELWVADAGEQKLSGHDDPPGTEPVRARVVLLVRVAFRTRKKHGRGSPEATREKVVSFEHYLTDFDSRSLPAGAVLDSYNARETEESFFRSEQDAFGAHYLRTMHMEGEAAFLQILASTVNLLRWVQASTFSGTPLERVGLTRLVTEIMRIPAIVIREAHQWIVLLPETFRLVRQFVSAWMERELQLPLPLSLSINTATINAT